MKLVEEAARAMAAEHYAERFSKPVNDAHVQANVDANWQIWTIRAEPIIALFLAALRREPSEGMVIAGGMKPGTFGSQLVRHGRRAGEGMSG